LKIPQKLQEKQLKSTFIEINSSSNIKNQRKPEIIEKVKYNKKIVNLDKRTKQFLTDSQTY